MKRPYHSALTPAEIARVRTIVAPFLRSTPTMTVKGSDLGLDAAGVTLKLEQLQHAGSFKTRGAFANLLLRPVPAAGVVTASGGNHGAAVAYAASRLGVAAKVFVPTVSSAAKVARIRSYGADLTIVGDRYADALAASEEWATRTGTMFIHAFDQVETLLGQGTLAAELATQAPEIDTILVAVGGGSLIGGVAAWYAGRCRIVGVEPSAAPTLTAAIAAGCPVDAPSGGIAADSLAPRRVGELMFPIAQAFVDRVLCVEDDDICRAQAMLWEQLRIVAEPGGAAAYAALMCRAYVPSPGERVAVVISGGNTTAVTFV